MGNNTQEKNNFCFTIPEQNRGWILDAICHEIARFSPEECAFVYYPCESLPSAKTYFLAHFSLLQKCLKEFPNLEDRQIFVWFTHPPKGSDLDARTIATLRKASKIICTNTQSTQALSDQGIPLEQVTCVLGGADPSIFLPHPRSQGAVGFSTAYYPRKAPDRILEIVRAMPHRQFLLLGRGWETYEHFAELTSLENFTYVETEYEHYPDYYNQLDVFVSPSYLEGGPIPLIETMMCNVVPVASNTGFAPDLIRHGENGFIFDVDSPVEAICSLVDAAFSLDTDIRSTVIDYTWEKFSGQIQTLQLERLGELENKVKQLRITLGQAIEESGRNKHKLQTTREKLETTRDEYKAVRRELDQLRGSKLWLLWQRYLALRRFLGFGR